MILRNILFLSVLFLATAKAGAQNNVEKVTNDAIEQYNNDQYGEALALLDSIKNSRSQYVNWYYYYALNQTRLQNYDQALENFQTYIKNTDITNTARAYYYQGLIQFYKGDFEKAMTSLELSLDVSTDPKLDEMTEALIERVIRYQNYYEKNKKTTLNFLAGYTYDTNVLNLSQDSFSDNLSGHILGYGASIAHKVVDKYNFVFEPALAVIDNYTFDRSFKANSTLQSVDALQVLASVPVRFYFEDEKLPNKFDFSLNAYSVYLPISSSARELSLSSFFLKGQVTTPWSNRFSVKYDFTLAADSSHGYSSDDDDASGLRLEFLTTFVNYLSDTDSTNMFYEAGADYSGTKGINTRYRKLEAAVGYMYPSYMNTLSSVRVGYHYLSYPDKATSRTDNLGQITYSVNKNLSEDSAVSFSAGADFNSSDNDLNDYNDFTLGVLYTKSFSF